MYSQAYGTVIGKLCAEADRLLLETEQDTLLVSAIALSLRDVVEQQDVACWGVYPRTTFDGKIQEVAIVSQKPLNSLNLFHIAGQVTFVNVKKQTVCVRIAPKARIKPFTIVLKAQAIQATLGEYWHFHCEFQNAELHVKSARKRGQKRKSKRGSPLLRQLGVANLAVSRAEETPYQLITDRVYLISDLLPWVEDVQQNRSTYCWCRTESGLRYRHYRQHRTSFSPSSIISNTAREGHLIQRPFTLISEIDIAANSCILALAIDYYKAISEDPLIVLQQMVSTDEKLNLQFQDVNSLQDMVNWQGVVYPEAWTTTEVQQLVLQAQSANLAGLVYLLETRSKSRLHLS